MKKQLKNNLLSEKKGLVVGIANERSLAWGIAESVYNAGGKLALTYQNEALKKRIEPLSDKVNSSNVHLLDLQDYESIPIFFKKIGKEFGKLDFIVHAVAFSDKEELKGDYVDTTKENFLKTLEVSCYSFTSLIKYALPILNKDASLLTLSYYGAEKVIPHYNVMGVAKSALETSVKYLSVDLGHQNVRVNAISAGPMRTLAGAAIANARDVFKYTSENSSLKRNVNLDELGNSALYLVSDLSSAITGEIHYVDCGFNIVGMPKS